MLFYQFSSETGSRRDYSIFYVDNLIVHTDAKNKHAVETIIEAKIGLIKRGNLTQYDTKFNRSRLVSELNAAGLPANFISPEEFFIH